MADQRANSGKAAWQVSLGAGNAVDLEFVAGHLWAALGSGIDDTSIWVKDVQGFDIRIGIDRSMEGLRVTLDRGENQPAWWLEDSAPAITLRFIPEAGKLTVIAQGPACVPPVLLAEVQI